MDLFSYLLGKQSGGGGGGDLSEYFNTEITSNAGPSSVPQILKKVPVLTIGENVTLLRYAFGETKADEFMGLENFTNRITSITSMFASGVYKKINLKNVDTSGVNNMDGVFLNCYNLEEVDLSSFNTSNVTVMSSMFYSCNSLTSLDLSSFDTSKVSTMQGMFQFCSNLTHLDIRNFTFKSGVTTTNMFLGIPANCEIVVKSQTEKDFVLNVRSDLTNVKTVDEL